MMVLSQRLETKEDLQLIKEYTLLPILLDMLTRDAEELKRYSQKIVYRHLLFYLGEVHTFIFTEMDRIRAQMKGRDIKILSTNQTAVGIEVEYKVGGYIHHFTMLRSLIKAELMNMLMILGRQSR
jgi:hypothetical protein